MVKWQYKSVETLTDEELARARAALADVERDPVLQVLPDEFEKIVAFSQQVRQEAEQRGGRKAGKLREWLKENRPITPEWVAHYREQYRQLEAYGVSSEGLKALEDDFLRLLLPELKYKRKPENLDTIKQLMRSLEASPLAHIDSVTQSRQETQAWVEAQERKIEQEKVGEYLETLSKGLNGESYLTPDESREMTRELLRDELSKLPPPVIPPPVIPPPVELDEVIAKIGTLDKDFKDKIQGVSSQISKQTDSLTRHINAAITSLQTKEDAQAETAKLHKSLGQMGKWLQQKTALQDTLEEVLKAIKNLDPGRANPFLIPILITSVIVAVLIGFAGGFFTGRGRITPVISIMGAPSISTQWYEATGKLHSSSEPLATFEISPSNANLRESPLPIFLDGVQVPEEYFEFKVLEEGKTTWGLYPIKDANIKSLPGVLQGTHTLQIARSSGFPTSLIVLGTVTLLSAETILPTPTPTTTATPTQVPSPTVESMNTPELTPTPSPAQINGINIIPLVSEATFIYALVDFGALATFEVDPSNATQEQLVLSLPMMLDDKPVPSGFFQYREVNGQPGTWEVHVVQNALIGALSEELQGEHTLKITTNSGAQDVAKLNLLTFLSLKIPFPESTGFRPIEKIIDETTQKVNYICRQTVGEASQTQADFEVQFLGIIKTRTGSGAETEGVLVRVTPPGKSSEELRCLPLSPSQLNNLLHPNSYYPDFQIYPALIAPLLPESDS